MKKSLLALAVLGAFAGAASAQSSVTLYGRVDLMLHKSAGSDNKDISNGSGSRLGLRGTEDLGGGLAATFNIEHRFNADTGELTNATKFWQGRSIVGLKGGWGEINLGREYTASFLGNQLAADPWGFDTTATMALFTTGAIGKVRTDNTINYNLSASGFVLRTQFAEADGNAPSQDRPLSLFGGYAAGPLNIGLSYENPSDADDKWMLFTAGYNFGAFRLAGAYGRGTNADSGTHRSYLVSVTAPIGAGEFRAAYGDLTNTTLDFKALQKFAVGYHYSLSKRTTIYADLSQSKSDGPLGANGKDSDVGYDFGLKHNF